MVDLTLVVPQGELPASDEAALVQAARRDPATARLTTYNPYTRSGTDPIASSQGLR